MRSEVPITVGESITGIDCLIPIAVGARFIIILPETILDAKSKSDQRRIIQ